MEIRKINEEVAFSGRLTAEELSILPRQGYRMLAEAAMPEEIQEGERHKAKQAGLRYVEIPVNPHAWSRESFLLLEQVLFPQKSRPALICSPQGRRAGVLALVWDAVQRARTVEETEATAGQFGLSLPEIAKEYLCKNSPAYEIQPKAPFPEALPFPEDDEVLPGDFHRPPGA
ncbi:MAG: sulfur transferase domain-containing protein [Candidatus Manganitrophus sp. SA1]|nr:sulfur transferase domain-containing protein [Candidatus Manganitrophus morganii]